MTVVSDTSPVNYLAQIGQERLLQALFGEITIPSSVLAELSHASAPLEIQRLLSQRPAWLNVAQFETAAPAELGHLGRGERDAILLAVELRAGLVLIDESRGRQAAEKLGLAVTGTIGILDRAARKGLVEGKEMATRLRATSFRATPRLLASLAEVVERPAATGSDSEPEADFDDRHRAE